MPSPKASPKAAPKASPKAAPADGANATAAASSSSTAAPTAAKKGGPKPKAVEAAAVAEEELTCFGPFRPVGVVCGAVTAAPTELYGQPMLMVPIRRTFQLYKGEKLALVRGGPEYECDISCVAQAGKLRYVAEGPRLHALSHHKPMWSKPHNAVLKGAVLGLVAIDDLLFSFGDDGKCVVWGGRSGEEVTGFTLALPPGVRYTCAAIPPHFKNKLLVGCSDGVLRLYNFATGKLIFSWTVPAAARSGPDAEIPTITCLTTSAYRGLIAVGTSDARAVVYHFEEDVVIAAFTHDSSRRDAGATGRRAADDDDDEEGGALSLAAKRHRGTGVRSAAVDRLRPSAAGDATLPAITALAFRADDEGRTLVTGNALGEIAFWDLQDKVLAGAVSGTKQVKGFDELLSNPHRDAVHTLFFVPNRPLLVSCGADNAMVEYRLDTVDGLALAIRDRRGHTGRCTAVQFYNSDLIVTAGEDRAVRVTHIFSDRAAWEMSQGKLGRRAREQGVDRDALRLPPATQLVCTPARNYQWASVVSVHDCSAKVCGWRLDTRALSNKIEPIRTTSHNCTAIAVSDCGNFAVVGYSSGHVARVNLQDQSLLHFYAKTNRRAAGSSNSGAKKGGAAQREDADRAHPEGARVTGVFVFQWADLVATCAADGTIRTWRLTTAEQLATLKLESPVHCLAGHSPSLLLCAGCADYKVRVVALSDGRGGESALTTIRPANAPGASAGATNAGAATKATATVVRTLEGHRAAITAVALSPESLRHLVTAADDGSLMAWDLAAAQCIAQYRLPSPATSVAFHPDSPGARDDCDARERGAVAHGDARRQGVAPRRRRRGQRRLPAGDAAGAAGGGPRRAAAARGARPNRCRRGAPGHRVQRRRAGAGGDVEHPRCRRHARRRRLRLADRARDPRRNGGHGQPANAG